MNYKTKNMMKVTTGLLTLFLAWCTLSSSAKDYRVDDFGAVPDGVTLNTRTIQYAVDLIHAEGGGRLIFPLGRYVSGTIHLRSNVTLHLEDGAILLGSTNPYDYDRMPGFNTAFLLAKDQENIGLTGEGTIDCRGRAVAYNLVEQIHKGVVKDALRLDRPVEGSRPMIIYFRSCRNVKVEGIQLHNSGSWVQTYDQCVGLTIDRIRVESNAYWNNDGLDVVDCENVTVTNSFFNAADDAICLKSHDANFMCKNVLIRNNVARSGASGIKFGTASNGGFKDIRILNNKVYDTYRSAITIASVDGGQIENVIVDTLRAINTGNIIYLRIGDRQNHGKKPMLKNVTIQNLYAQVPATKPDKGYDYEGPIEDLPRNISPSSIIGLPDYPIENITLRNVEIVYPGAGNEYYANVGLTPADLDSIPEMRKSYPEFSQFKELPAWGMYIRHARGITFENVTMKALEPDYRPAIVTDDVKGLRLTNTRMIEPEADGKEQVFFYKTDDVTLQ